MTIKKLFRHNRNLYLSVTLINTFVRHVARQNSAAISVQPEKQKWQNVGMQADLKGSRSLLTVHVWIVDIEGEKEKEFFQIFSRDEGTVLVEGTLQYLLSQRMEKRSLKATVILAFVSVFVQAGFPSMLERLWDKLKRNWFEVTAEWEILKRDNLIVFQVIDVWKRQVLKNLRKGR